MNNVLKHNIFINIPSSQILDLGFYYFIVTQSLLFLQTLLQSIPSHQSRYCISLIQFEKLQVLCWTSLEFLMSGRTSVPHSRGTGDRPVSIACFEHSFIKCRRIENSWNFVSTGPSDFSSSFYTCGFTVYYIFAYLILLSSRSLRYL